MDRVISALSHELPRMSPQMARAATLVLDRPGAVAVNSMRALAAKAEVSPPTMLRLAQRLGFDSYEAFREVFKRHVADTDYGGRAQHLVGDRRSDGLPRLAETTSESIGAGLHRIQDPAFQESLRQAAGMMAAAERCLVVASSGAYGPAVSFQYVCRMASPKVELASSGGISSINGLTAVGPADLVLGVSIAPYASSTVEALHFGRRQGARILAVTDRPTSPLAAISHLALTMETPGPHFFPSMVGMTMVMEMLSAAFVIASGQEAVDRIARFGETLQANGFYWGEGA